MFECNVKLISFQFSGRESHVFKYADKAALFFTCQISITIKEPGGQCVRPTCAEPGGPGAAAGAAGGTAAPRAAIPAAAKATAGAAKATAGGAAKATPPRPAPKGTAKPVTPPAAPPPGATPPPPPPTSPKPAPAGAVEAANAQVQEALLVQDENDENKSKRRNRIRRSTFESERLGVWDVKAQPITALDLEETSSAPLNQLTQVHHHTNSTPPSTNDFCISPISFGMMMGVVVISSLTAIVVCLLLCFRRPSLKMV